MYILIVALIWVSSNTGLITTHVSVKGSFQTRATCEDAGQKSMLNLPDPIIERTGNPAAAYYWCAATYNNRDTEVMGYGFKNRRRA